MKIFIYPESDCILSSGNLSFFIPKQNAVKTELMENEIITADFGKNMQVSKLSTKREFCRNTSITDLYGDLLYILNPKPLRNASYKILKTKSFTLSGREIILTLFSNGGYFLNVKCYKSNTTLELPFPPCDFELNNLHGDFFAVTVTDEKHYYFAVFALHDLSVIFKTQCDGLDFSSEVCIIKKHEGVYPCVQKDYYSFNKKFEFQGNTFSFDYSKNVTSSLLFKLAFLQQVRLYADYRHFLSEDLLKEYELTRKFFGNFSIIISPFYRDYNELFAIIGESVRYVKLEMAGGKISDIVIENHPF